MSHIEHIDIHTPQESMEDGPTGLHGRDAVSVVVKEVLFPEQEPAPGLPHLLEERTVKEALLSMLQESLHLAVSFICFIQSIINAT